MAKYSILLIGIFLFFTKTYSQVDSLELSGEQLLYYKAGDSLPVLSLDSIVILPKMRFSNYRELRRYRWIRRKIYKVYPFAKMAGDNLVELEQRLNKMKTKRQRKRYIKIIQRWIKKDLEPQLKNLTQSEGRFLSKLVYRQTGQTVYDILKKYKSGWTAWWYQRMAKLYHVDLKVKFDPVNNKEDYWIEDILQRAFRDEILEPQPNKLGYRYTELHNKWKPTSSKNKTQQKALPEKVLHLHKK
jgi:hypothetical protein